MSVIEESCGTELERITSSPGKPLSWCSRGTVTSSSTSAAERPSVGVWISTRSGANSGKTSTRASRLSSVTPKTIMATAARTTMKRNLRLDPTIQRIVRAPSRRLVVDLELGPEQESGAHAHDVRADTGPVGKEGERPVDALDLDRGPDEDQRLGAGVDPCLSVRVVEH